MELVALPAAILLILGAGWALQRQFIYFPESHRPPPAASVLPTAEDVALRTDDGIELGGWFVPGGRTAVLVLNGNAGDRSHRAPLASALARAGLSVLLFDYRGYGGNPGSPSERGLLADARAAVRYVGARADVDPTRIVYFGESLGAGVAVALALERPPAALVLRSPFSSLADMGRHHYALLPVWLALVDRYPVVEQIAEVAAPVLVVAGARDSIVPLAQSQRVYEAARGPKRFALIRGADHNDLELVAGQRVVAETTQFVRENAP